MTIKSEYDELRDAGMTDHDIRMARNTGASHGAVLAYGKRIQRETAQKCAELCEESEVLLPMSAWETRRSVSAATAEELGKIIRRTFALDGGVEE